MPEKKKKQEEIPEIEAEVAHEETASPPENKPNGSAVGLDALREEVAQSKDRLLRLAAEDENFRRRTAAERESVYASATADAVTAFLPVYDNLLRAVGQPTADEAYAKGVQMIFNQFNEQMLKLGVTPIETENKPFDANLHEAVMHVEDESLGESVIVEEFQRGFQMGDRVIRHSMVKVAN